MCEQRDGNRTPLILRRHTTSISVEATAPAQGRVERVGSVRRANDNDSFSLRAGAVHFAKESGEQSRSAQPCRAACAKRVHFIEEDYRGRAPSCVGECSDEPAFGIHAVAEQVRQVDVDDRHALLEGNVRTSSVFPVPGGPCSSTPRGAMPSRS